MILLEQVPKNLVGELLKGDHPVFGQVVEGEIHVVVEGETLALVPFSARGEHGMPVHHLAGSREVRVPYYGFAQATYFGRELAGFIRGKSELANLHKLVCTHDPAVIEHGIIDGNAFGWLPLSHYKRSPYRARRLVRAGSATYHLGVHYVMSRPSKRLPANGERSWSEIKLRMRALP